MKTIDLRVRESVDSVCALPDIEEDEIDIDNKECEAAEQPEDADEATHDDTRQRTESRGGQRCFVRLLWLCLKKKIRPRLQYRK